MASIWHTTVFKKLLLHSGNMMANRKNMIIYWVATLWLSLGMAATGIVQLIRLPDETAMMHRLGYPDHVLTLIGIWKVLGVLAILVPRRPLLKEWAYAGFFFVMSGALFAHGATGDEAKEFFGPSLLIVLTVVSWLYRPPGRRVPTTVIR